MQDWIAIEDTTSWDTCEVELTEVPVTEDQESSTTRQKDLSSHEQQPDAFPVSSTINSSIRIHHGDPCLLDVDCLAFSVAEQPQKLTSLAKHILDAAGEDLLHEVYQSTIRTGEGLLFPGFSLPASNVVACIDPRYSRRYYSASINSLHNCVRASLQHCLDQGFSSICLTPLWSKGKEFPNQDAIHIVLRTLRKFLTRLDNVPFTTVLCVPKDMEDVYSKLLSTMPYYFPRSEAEVSFTFPLLPADIGNEWGEYVDPERNLDVCESILPTNTELFDNIDNFADFSTLSVDPDTKRTNRSKKQAEIEQYRADFVRLQRASRTQDLTSVSSSGFLFKSSINDNADRPLFCMIGKALDQTSDQLRQAPNLDQVVMFIIRLMDRFVDSEFSFIYVASDVKGTQRPDLSWFKWVLSILPPKYFRNCKNFIILHPSFKVKAKLFGLQAFLMNTEAGRFISSCRSVKRISDLAEFVDVSQLSLPSFVQSFDSNLK
ncbi:hypothetical protein P9112_003271 [Eukaryota sp. TZLM1-RC]